MMLSHVGILLLPWVSGSVHFPALLQLVVLHNSFWSVTRRDHGGDYLLRWQSYREGRSHEVEVAKSLNHCIKGR